MPIVLNRHKKTALIIFSTFIVLLILVLFLSKQEINLKEILGYIQATPLSVIFLALVFDITQIFFMSLRLFVLRPASPPTALSLHAKAVSIGQALNSFVPARLGDLAKLFYLNKKGKGLSAIEGAGLLMADKLVDIAAILLLALVFTFQELAENKSKIIYFGMGILIVALILVVFKKWLFTSRPKLAGFLKAIEKFKDPKILISTFSFGLLVWICETFALLFLIRNSLPNFSFSNAFLIVYAVNLSISVPLSVANIGAFEAAIVFILGKSGLGYSESIAIASLHHIIQISAFSVCALFFIGATFFSRQTKETLIHS